MPRYSQIRPPAPQYRRIQPTDQYQPAQPQPTEGLPTDYPTTAAPAPAPRPAASTVCHYPRLDRAAAAAAAAASPGAGGGSDSGGQGRRLGAALGTGINTCRVVTVRGPPTTRVCVCGGGVTKDELGLY